jgi:hypothetical protein
VQLQVDDWWSLEEEMVESRQEMRLCEAEEILRHTPLVLRIGAERSRTERASNDIVVAYARR